MTMLALRFISGKYKGGEYLLKEGREIIIGRSSDLDIVLMEDMVSRKHAFLRVENEKIRLRDGGSTNGTFINGEKVAKKDTVSVVKGDRILIGTSIMKVVDSSGQASTINTGESTSRNKSPHGGYQELGRTTMHSGARSMAGTIADVPLPDLIQLFSTSKKTGTLVLNNEFVIAKIHLDKGRIIYATTSDQPDLAPLKAMFRILSWDDGTFELLGPEPHNFPDQINMPTEHILMEGLRQLDELRHTQDKLPPAETQLMVAKPLQPKLSVLSPEELEIFQLVLENPTIKELLDLSTLPDKDTAEILHKLIKKKYFEIDDFI